MSEPRVVLTIIEEEDRLASPVMNPRRIVKVVQDGNISTYLVPREGPTVGIIEIKRLPSYQFQQLWNKYKKGEAT